MGDGGRNSAPDHELQNSTPADAIEKHCRDLGERC